MQGIGFILCYLLRIIIVYAYLSILGKFWPTSMFGGHLYRGLKINPDFWAKNLEFDSYAR